MHVTAAIIQTAAGNCYPMRADGTVATVCVSDGLSIEAQEEITAHLRVHGFDDVVFSASPRGDRSLGRRPAPIEFDMSGRVMIFRDGTTKPITRSEHTILKALLRASPGAVHRETLIQMLYGSVDPPLGADNTTNAFISNIRRKVRNYVSIKAVYGEGYSLTIL